MKFTTLNNTEVIFKSCPVHTELRYAGEQCPVCVAYKLLCQKDDRIAELETELQDKDPF